jgi:hypothetical protein
MSGTTRQKTFVELVSQRTPANARNDLDVYSRSETLLAIPEVDLSGYTPLSTTLAISGGLDSLEASTIAISAGLTTDIENLDISLSQAIFTHISVDGTSPTITGAAYAWGRIDAISGGPLYVQLFK